MLTGETSSVPPELAKGSRLTAANSLAVNVHENLVKWYCKPCQELVAASVIGPRGNVSPFFSPFASHILKVFKVYIMISSQQRNFLNFVAVKAGTLLKCRDWSNAKDKWQWWCAVLRRTFTLPIPRLSEERTRRWGNAQQKDIFWTQQSLCTHQLTAPVATYTLLGPLAVLTNGGWAFLLERLLAVKGGLVRVSFSSVV